MIISVTERGVFRRCRQMWDYSSFNRQGLTPFIPPTALSFGTMIHKCHEEWLLHPDDPLDDTVMRVIALGLRELKANYKKMVGVEPSEVELKGFFEQAELAMDMMLAYKTKWGSSLPDGYTLMAPEQTILVPIPGTEHYCPWDKHGWGVPKTDEMCEFCAGTKVVTHTLEATLDALIRDEGGQVWVLERKTFGNHPRPDVLDNNDQFLAYIWALTQLDVGPVGGVLYDGMWKRKWEKGRTLDELFLRKPLIRAPEEIENFSVQVRDEALDMADPGLRIYRNRVWQGCWDCRFDPLCTAEFRGEDSQYVRERNYVSRTRNEWQNEAVD